MNTRCFTNPTDLTSCHPSTLASILLHKSKEAMTVQCAWTCKDFYSIPLFLTVQVVHLFSPPCILLPSPLCLGTAAGEGGGVRHAGAHSFLSDTELSHCEQFLCGSMLTNELSSVSSEKSCQSANRSRKSELCVHRSARENIFRQLIKIMQIFNGGHGFRSNNVYGSPAVIYPNENMKSAAGEEVVNKKKHRSKTKMCHISPQIQ